MNFLKVLRCKALNTLMLLSALSLLVSGCVSLGMESKRPPQTGLQSGMYDFAEKAGPKVHTPNSKTHKILATACTQIGNPYKFGGMKPETGFDCSGFVQWVYKQNGIKIPRRPKDQLNAGQRVNKEDLRPGDLVFYKEPYLHVGMYVGENKFIHSPHTGDVIKESEAFDDYHEARFAGAVRFVDEPHAKPLPPEIKEDLVATARAKYKSGIANNRKKNRSVNRTSVAAKPAAKPAKRYTVKKGDTVWKVARQFGVPHKKIEKANNLGQRYTLRVGQKLIIP